MFLTRKIESNFLAAIFLFFFFPSSRYDKNLDDEVEKEEKRKERETRIFSAERREKKLEERGKKKNYRKIRSLGTKTLDDKLEKRTWQHKQTNPIKIRHGTSSNSVHVSKFHGECYSTERFHLSTLAWRQKYNKRSCLEGRDDDERVQQTE